MFYVIIELLCFYHAYSWCYRLLQFCTSFYRPLDFEVDCDGLRWLHTRYDRAIHQSEKPSTLALCCRFRVSTPQQRRKVVHANRSTMNRALDATRVMQRADATMMSLTLLACSLTAVALLLCCNQPLLVFMVTRSRARFLLRWILCSLLAGRRPIDDDANEQQQ